MPNTDAEGISSGLTPEPPVSILVSSDIIEQYARHLYTNPRKAVEELACNSYDAGAKICIIKTPSHASNALVIMDDGESMDRGGLEAMWRVGKSPKKTDDVHRLHSTGRHVIGKFGVGKLAAFALGSRLTHYVHKNGETRRLRVDLNEIKEQESSASEEELQNSKFTVYRMNAVALTEELGPFLADMPLPWEQGWDSWTVALVDEINVPDAIQTLQHGVLKLMIASAMPIYTDFRVILNGEPVSRKTFEEKNVLERVPLHDPRVTAQIESNLRKWWAVKLGVPLPDVPEEKVTVQRGEMQNPHDSTSNQECIIVPGVGMIQGEVLTFQDTITSDKVQERGYSNNGYFVRVHDKLLNPGDNQFGQERPQSYQTWQRCHINIEAPDLDYNILVNRNEVGELGNRAELVRSILQGCFNVARQIVEPALKKRVNWNPAALFTRILQHSPTASDFVLQGLEPPSPDWQPEMMGLEMVEEPHSGLTKYNPKTGNIELNAAHQLSTALNLSEGKNEKGEKRAIKEILGGIEIICAYLNGMGVASEVEVGVRQLWDGLAIAAAGQVDDALKFHKQRLEDTHLEGDKQYEMAICAAFDALGLAVNHIGASGNPDGKLKIIVPGGENQFISVEAKGGNSKLDHGRADVATIQAHRSENGCGSAILVAKETNLRGSPPGKPNVPSRLIQNCQQANPPILIFPHERIIQLLELHAVQPFAREQLLELLTTWRHPEILENHILEVWNGQIIDKKYDLQSIQDLLEIIDKLSEAKPVDRPSPQAISVMPPVSEWDMSEEEIWGTIVGIHRFCRTGLLVDSTKRTCWLRFKPTIVLQEYMKNLTPRGIPS